MKLLIDMNLSPLWVEFLAGAGFVSIHWSAVGRPSAPDSEIAKHNLRQPSVIQIRTQDVLPSAIGEIVLRALRACRLHLQEGALVTVDLNRQRIRLLPFTSASKLP
jgi:predicted nuclease of predicted toxin-antitoxin system